MVVGSNPIAATCFIRDFLNYCKGIMVWLLTISLFLSRFTLRFTGREVGMKKIIIAVIALILIIAVSATSIVIAQDNPSEQKSVKLENELNRQLEKTLNLGLIDQELVDRVKNLWSDKSDEEQLQLYKRVANMIQSKHKQVRLENVFLDTLEKAIKLGCIAPEKYREIVNLWEQKSPVEQQKLYERLCNMFTELSKKP
jgi:hypothetical protein